MRIVFVFVLTALICLTHAARSDVTWIDTTIGSGGEGYGIGSMNPGAQVPWGLARVGPDTEDELVYIPWNHFAGYYYNNDIIRTFSHTHVVGAGALGLGLVGIMPCDEAPDSHIVKDYGFKSHFSHDDETAAAGYYSVRLSDSNVLAEMSATAHTGVHRYTFDAGVSDPYIYLYACTGVVDNDVHGCQEAQMAYNETTQEFSGYVINDGFGGAIQFYFVYQFSQPIESFGMWANDTVFPSETMQVGNDIGAYVGFAANSTGTVVQARVGLSMFSAEQARANLYAEQPVDEMNETFDWVYANALSAWEDILAQVNITGGTDVQRTEFFTHWYQVHLAPTNYTEANGMYKGMDFNPHPTPANRSGYYSDISLWDEFRSKEPLLMLLNPKMSSDIIWSMTMMAEQGGGIPRWPLAYFDTESMIGDHGWEVIVGAYLKGVPDIDIPFLFEKMYEVCTGPTNDAGRSDIDGWLNNGYVASDNTSHSVSKTLAYAYDDYMASTMAAALGDTYNASRFYNSSENWRNLWDVDRKIFCGRKTDGSVDCPLQDDFWTQLYTEGNARQWAWFVPQNIPGLIDVFKSVDDFVDSLDEFFALGAIDPLNVLPNTHYWAGNEPDLLAPWLFPYAGVPAYTQKWSRKQLTQRYTAEADGLPGNNDYGTMSAWLVFAQLGFYPVSGTTAYVIGSPLYSKAFVDLPQQGTNITVIAHGASTDNMYVQNCTLNGVALTSAIIEHSDLVVPGGATLECTMGPSASSWATGGPLPKSPGIPNPPPYHGSSNTHHKSDDHNTQSVGKMRITE